MKSQPKINPLIFETYLAVIKNSVGSKTWQNFYAKIDDRDTDILKNGDLSCAFFVSSILVMLNLLEKIHGTVAGVIFDLEKSGWQKTKKLKPGAVIVWVTKVDKKGESHKHLGFCLDKKTAISNSSKTRKIAKHHLTFGTQNGQPIRAIEAIYTHKKLN
ncbi:MAG: hypothetical protein WC387_03270 [Candidatus Paceibacterota bacterium]|jgi:hypothetical protein